MPCPLRGRLWTFMNRCFFLKNCVSTFVKYYVFSLVYSRPQRAGMWRNPSSLSGEFAHGSKPPPLTRVAQIGLGRGCYVPGPDGTESQIFSRSARPNMPFCHMTTNFLFYVYFFSWMQTRQPVSRAFWKVNGSRHFFWEASEVHFNCEVRAKYSNFG